MFAARISCLFKISFAGRILFVICIIYLPTHAVDVEQFSDFFFFFFFLFMAKKESESRRWLRTGVGRIGRSQFNLAIQFGEAAKCTQSIALREPTCIVYTTLIR